jgi:flavodoxin/ferredoxin
VKCIVIYFSQTGNTEKIARAIQAGVKQLTGHCDIAKIKDVNPRRLYEYDLIGLGCPVIGGEPDNISAFINNLRFVGGKHAFAFASHGAQPDDLFPSMVPRMQRRGMVVIGMRGWYGDCYLLTMPQPYATAGHPDEIDIKEAEVFGREMVERSWRISAGESALIPQVPPARPLPKGRDDVTPKSFPSLVKFSKEKCLYPQCRLCMDNCPMEGIDLSVEPPVIGKPCLGCEFCARLCPTGAIDAGDFYIAMSGAHSSVLNLHPFPALDKAEAEGRFRRLLPKEKIGLDTYGYTVSKKHPQWIIGKGPQQ